MIWQNRVGRERRYQPTTPAQAARALLPPFRLAYPPLWPNLGLHCATLAKLELLCGDPLRAAGLDADRRATEMEREHAEQVPFADRARLSAPTAAARFYT